MGVETIDGDLQPAEPAGGRRKYAHYKGGTIATAGSQVRTLGKFAAGGAMIDEIRRGGQGRWYVATSGGGTAIIGVRRADGAAVYAHYMNIETMLLVVGLLGVGGAVLKFGFGVEDFPLTPCVLGPLLVIGWYWFRSQRLEQRRYFETDVT